IPPTCAFSITVTKLSTTADRLRRQEVECTTAGSPSTRRTVAATTSSGSSSEPTSRYQGAGPQGPVRAGVSPSSQSTNTSAWTGPSTSNPGMVERAIALPLRQVAGRVRRHRHRAHLLRRDVHVVQVPPVLLHQRDHLLVGALHLEAARAANDHGHGHLR